MDADPVADADIAAWLRRRPNRAALPVADRTQSLPASTAQRRLWFDDQIRARNPGGSTIYHSTLLLRRSGTVDVPALRDALDIVVNRHETLRTTYTVSAQDVLRQVVDQPGRVDLHVHHSSGDIDDRRARMTEFFRLPFDLEGGRPIRVGLFTLDPTDHLLLLVAHHIATDGWSMGILRHELGIAYRTLRAGRRPVLPTLTRQYADFACWEQAELDRGAFQDDVDYWTARLGAAPHVLDLPADRPRPRWRSFDGARVGRAVPAEIVATAERVAAAGGASLLHVLLATVQLLLARWSDRPDLIVGMPAANRRSAETEAMVGCFVNLLPIRGRIDESQTFARLLSDTRDAVLEAYDHAALSFDRLVAAVAPDRVPGANPLVQAVLTFADTGPGTTGAGPDGSWGEHVEFLATDKTQFDLTFAVRPDGAGGLVVDLHYATELFESTSIDRLGDRLVGLLADLVDRPTAPLALIPTVAPAEAAELNAFAVSPTPARTGSVVDMFTRQVAARPEAPAVIDDAVTLTYGQLGALVGRIGSLVRARRLPPGTAVGVCLPRSALQVAAILGVMQSGAGYLPLDPDAPPERLRHLLTDAGSPLVLSTADLRTDGRWPAPVEVLDLAVEQAAMPEVAGRPEVLPGQPAYLIYTSGSTGRPKGVQVSHASLGAFVSWYVDRYRLGAADRLAQSASPSFDAGLLDTLPALAAGAGLVVLPDEARLDPVALWDRLADAGVTVAFLTTALFSAAAGGLGAYPGRLRAVQIGGEQLPAVPDVLPFELDNLYGPTEVTIAATHGRLEAGRRVHIGGPLGGMRARVLDRWLRPVPVGVPGEIHLSGPGVAIGYRGAAGLTAGRFVPDPWSADGTRTYRTGDLARWTADGRLEYLGRRDAQVKVRGFRIEPGEIESVLGAYPGVLQAVVEPRVAAGGGLRLCAYLRVGPGTDVGAVRAYTERTLPGWMCPDSYTVLPRLPVTGNGKIDRAALPEPGLRDTTVYAPPQGPVEQLVAEVWGEVLGVREIGTADDFFRIGGHSLLATSVLSRLSEATGCRLPLRVVFDHPVLKDLAGQIEEAIISAALAEETR